MCHGMDRHCDDDGKTRDAFVKAVTDCMRNEVSGDAAAGRTHQWTLPLTQSSDQVAPKSMTATHSRKCVMGLKWLVDDAFAEQFDEKSVSPQQTRQKNDALRLKWHQLADACTPMMAAIKQHDDFTDEEMDQLHLKTNQFVVLWVDLHQGEGITNCIHMMGAGHLHCFLSKHRNLHKFSQQGWEAMNQKTKHFCFKNANHGGCLGNSTGDKVSGDHVLPTMRMHWRFVVWSLGHGECHFTRQRFEKEQFSSDSDSETEQQMELEFGELQSLLAVVLTHEVSS